MGDTQSNVTLRELVLRDYDYTCQYCNTEFGDSPHRLQLVPIEPVSEAGQTPENFKPYCDRCATLPKPSVESESEDTTDPFTRRLEALDRSQSVKAFGDDGLQIVKIGLSLPIALSALVGLGTSPEQLQNVSLLTNGFFLTGMLCWAGSLVLAGSTWYYSRVSGSSPPVVERLFETADEDLPDEDLGVTAETRSSYQRNAVIIAVAILVLAVSLVLFVLAYLDILGSL